ncbi:MAG: hypothetical protein KGM60_11980 [Comamonadaceae bacterium]|nr:hypothetical protein [Pseudomonadota bacterium]MDE2415470.1 hypothetical protein [Comamonadaceae bacterium]
MNEARGARGVVVLRQEGAPPKPPLGAPCNGCGLCCLLEPCPLGMVLSRRRSGACVMLRWDEAQQRYGCGALMAAPQGWLGLVRQRLVRRWIAAGAGCDADLQAQAPPQE